jgi:hypothetical protein
VCRNSQSGLVINRLTSVLAAKRYAIVSKHKNSTCAIPSPEIVIKHVASGLDLSLSVSHNQYSR